MYTVGGISKPDAIKYLVTKKFDKGSAEQVVSELTGDRLSLIVHVSQWPGESLAGKQQISRKGNILIFVQIFANTLSTKLHDT
jgi:hypothetical protein